MKSHIFVLKLYKTSKESMKLFSKLMLSALLVALPTSTLVAANSARDKADKEMMRKVDALMKKMTLREKIGQLIQMRPSEGAITGPDGEPLKVEDFIREGCCGSLLSVTSPDEIMRYQRLAVDSSRLGIPLLFGHNPRLPNYFSREPRCVGFVGCGGR